MRITNNRGNFFWMGCLAIIILLGLVKAYSCLMWHTVFTNKAILDICAPGPSIVGKATPFIQKTSDLCINIYILLRSQLLFGFIVSCLCGWRALLREGFVSVKVAMFIFIGFFVGVAIWVGLLKGPDWIGWWPPAFLAECAPVWAYLTIVYESWKTNRANAGDFKNVGKFQRGARLIKPEKSSKVIDSLANKEIQEGAKPGISIWKNSPFPFARENQHVLITGSPGAGKTQIIYPMVEQVYKRGDKAIIWDVKGTFIQAFAGQEGVDLLAAWDKRSIAWSPSEDIRSQLDCQHVASIMVPANPRESQPFFLNAARQILEAIFLYLDLQGENWGWGDVWGIISKDRKEVASLLSTFTDGRAAANMISGDSKSTEDVYSTLITHAQGTIRWYAKAWPQNGISLRKWAQGNSKLLIIGGSPDRVDLAQATANIAIEVIISEILSMADDPNRRIWLFLDELATLGKLDALLKAFSLGRSKGLCVVAGIQDIGKIEHYYGHMLAKSIANTFSTMIFLRCSDVDTSRWASAVLGEQDVIETHRSRSETSEGVTESEHEQMRTRPLFTPTEVTHFDNLTGVIRISGWPLLNVKWPYHVIPQTNKLVEEADWLKKKTRTNGFPQEPTAQWRLDP